MSNCILQPPKYLITVGNRLRYINNNVTKDMCTIPTDMAVVLGLHKFRSFITPTALVHPLHPIRRRSRNTRRNLRVGWCVFFWRPCYWSIFSIFHIGNWNTILLRYIYIPIVGVTNDGVLVDMVLLLSLACLVSNVWFKCIIQDSVYHNMDIRTMWHCELVSCTLSHSMGLLFVVCVDLVLSVILCSFYWSLDRVLFHHDSCDYYWEVLYPLFFILNCMLSLLYWVVLILQMSTTMDVSAPGHSFWILDWTCYLRTPLCNV